MIIFLRFANVNGRGGRIFESFSKHFGNRGVPGGRGFIYENEIAPAFDAILI